MRALHEQQAPSITWRYEHVGTNSVTLRYILQQYCDEYALDAQHASLSNQHGEDIDVETVSHLSLASTSAVLEQ